MPIDKFNDFAYSKEEIGKDCERKEYSGGSHREGMSSTESMPDESGRKCIRELVLRKCQSESGGLNLVR